MTTNNEWKKVGTVFSCVAVLGLSAYALTRFVNARQTARKCCGGGSCKSKASESAAANSSSGSSSSSSAEKKARVVFVLGGPGAGKGTQCSMITHDFGFVHLSAGDLLRDEQQKGGEVGTMIKKLIAEGAIVPVAVTLGLLKNAMQEHMKMGSFKFLIDGFPRNQDNLDGWNNTMDGFAEVEFCLVLDCPEDVMEQRLLKRGETSGRADDNAASIKKRFLTFVQSTKPVIETFEKQDKMRIVSAAKPVEEVREEVKKIFQSVQW